MFFKNIIIKIFEILPSEAAVLIHRTVRAGERNRRANEIKKDKKYFKPSGFWPSNRVIHQIRLLLDKNKLNKL